MDTVTRCALCTGHLQLPRKPADFVASISLSYLGDMQLELIEPVRGPNIYSDFLRDSGPGLHHICVEADTLGDFDTLLSPQPSTRVPRSLSARV